MNVLCTSCHLEMEETPALGCQVLMRRPREVLLPDRILNIHTFVCPRCNMRVVISFEIDTVTFAPGHEIRDALGHMRRDPRFSIYFNYQSAIDQTEGEDLGFIDREAKIPPPGSQN